MTRLPNVTRGVLAALLIAAGGLSAQSPARIEHGLRPAVRLLDRPDTTFDLLERMRFYHVPGVSIAVIDDFKVVYALSLIHI